MPVFEHASFYPHPRAEVFAWHERPGAFVRLTPPGMAVVTDGPTDGIRDGSRVSLRISHPVVAGGSAMLGLPGVPSVAWTLRHLDHVAGVRFADEQVTGPFRSWRHEHLFSDGPDGGTVITDRVTWELPVPATTAIVHGQLGRFFRFREDQLREDLALHARLSGPGERLGETSQVTDVDAPAPRGPAPRPLHVAVAGSSGLIGTQLCALLTTGGHRVTRLVRRDPAAGDEVRWDPGATDSGRGGGRPGRLDAAALADVDAVVNLAGRSIAGRFTRGAKQEIHHSRIDASDTLARALAGMTDGRERALVQASGIGLYGARRPGQVLTERSAPGGGFLADVVRHWEAATTPASDAGVRVVKLRIGVVLSEVGGALLPQLPLFGLGVGGPLADPEAVISWITLDDVARSFVHALGTRSLSGAYNAVAPQPATYRELAMTLGRTLSRPAAIPTPGWLPRAVLGRSGYDQVIRTDQRVSSAALQKSAFRFAHPDLERALRHVLRR